MESCNGSVSVLIECSANVHCTIAFLCWGKTSCFGGFTTKSAVSSLFENLSVGHGKTCFPESYSAFLFVCVFVLQEMNYSLVTDVGS